MNYIELTHKKIDISEINDLVAHESCGAISFFVGTTRNNFEDKEVVSLEYESYDSMAVKAITKICDEIRFKWVDIVNIGIYHRLGLVPVKEASVIIAISSPHRNASLEAVQFAIETLKRIVPIWKKEKYSHPEGSSAWKENKESIKRRRSSLNENETNSINKKLKLRPHLNFENCAVNDIPVAKNLIQINADENEIERRVNCFVERNREEIDSNNIQDFVENTGNDNEEYSCARVNSTNIKARNSKFHLRVNRVKNICGPQININYTGELDRLMEQTTHPNIPIKLEPNQSPTKNGIEERLTNIEKYFGVGPVSKNVYERLKKVEDRILYLESLSPEYSHFMENTANVKSEKKTYTSGDLENYIRKIQSQINL